MSISLNHNRAALTGGRSTQEAVMGQVIPGQNPAVVLRSHYRQLRSLLAIALVAVVGLSVALVILATDDESTTTTRSAQAGQPLEYGGFNPQTGKPVANVATSDVATAKVATPDESKIAAATWRAQQAASSPEAAIPDESKSAAAVSRAQQSGPAGPDESRTAAAIGR
jgi:hypothetical protein